MTLVQGTVLHLPQGTSLVCPFLKLHHQQYIHEYRDVYDIMQMWQKKLTTSNGSHNIVTWLNNKHQQQRSILG